MKLNMTKEEYYSNDYDLSKYAEDRRLVQCRKEAKLTVCIEVILVVVLFIVYITMAFADPAQMSYIFGIPAWAAISYIILICILAAEIFISQKVFANFPFEDEDEANKEVQTK